MTRAQYDYMLLDRLLAIEVEMPLSEVYRDVSPAAS